MHELKNSQANIIKLPPRSAGVFRHTIHPAAIGSDRI
jgi:hypothetical protein